ncbi:MAG: transketolase [Bacteroidales bacterium]|jgi:transketolase|nr:transketolase [Bacteroidales bacterium]MBQ9889670.1 transketolase [Bacteroidales bacterium]
MASKEELKGIASQVRRDIIRMVSMAGSGHPGGSMSSTDFMTALYFNVMDQTPETWTRDGKGQDVFILSAGHLAPVLYAVLARRGYFPAAELGSLRKYGSRLQGHPSVQKNLPGVHQAAGSLGQGLSCAAGVALAKKLDKDDKKVYVLCGDGESEEGQIWEAGIFAAHHKLDNLIAFTDWNGQQIDGKVEDVGGLGDLQAKWEAFGWKTIVTDGHDFDAILAAFEEAGKSEGKPVMILFRSEMGHGVDFMAGTHKWHGKAPNQEQVEEAMKQLDETMGDF